MSGGSEAKAARESVGDTPEAALVRRAKGGDSTAFDELVGLHERRVLGTARRLVVHAADAGDAAQEVFVRLYRNLRRIDPKRPLAAWLYRVTVNVCHDLNRGRLRFRPMAIDEVPPAAEPIATDRRSDPEAAVEETEKRRLLERFLTRLPPGERTALVLRELEGLSTAEVARVQRSTAVTVRSQISKARRKLRRFYTSYLEEGSS